MTYLFIWKSWDSKMIRDFVSSLSSKIEIVELLVKSFLGNLE